METIKQAKTFFTLILLIGITISAVSMRFYYKDTINTKDSLHKDTIESKDAQIEQLKGLKTTVKSIVFDGTGKVLDRVGVEKIIINFQVTPLKNGKHKPYIIIKLETKEELINVPLIQTITDRFWVKWTSKRESENIITWTGDYRSYTDEEIPKFKMEIYK